MITTYIKGAGEITRVDIEYKRELKKEAYRKHLQFFLNFRAIFGCDIQAAQIVINKLGGMAGTW